MTDLISRDALLGAAPRRFAVVPIEGLGNVRIRSLTELERSRIEVSMRDKRGNLSSAKSMDLKSRLIVDCVVDAQGNQLYTNNDIQHLRRQDSKVTNALVDAIQAHCGWSDDDIEDLEKNSGATAGEGSR